MDFSPATLDLIRTAGHPALPATPAGWSKIPDGSVSLIRLSHVLEHLYSPLDTLKQIASKLKPGGVVHLTLPNPSSWGAAFFKMDWFPLECPRHIILHPPENLRRILEIQGFDRIEVLCQPDLKNWVRSSQYRLASMRLLNSVNSSPFQRSTHLCLALPFAWLSALFGHSDIFHLFGQKKTNK